MITLKDVLKKSKDFLEQKGVNDPRRQAEDVLSHCLSIPRIDLYLRFDQPLEEKELLSIRENLSRRAKREPLQYIEGVVSFYKSSFKVSKDVLIPRPETEQLVEKIAEKLKFENLENKTLWDLCTGSGCIGISLKKEFPQLRVILTDLSEDALQLAAKNAEELGVEVELYQGDLFKAYQSPVDYLVSNPPYVSEKEFNELEPEVRLYEPKCAFVPGPSGLEIYEQIAKELRNNLKKQGLLWMEIGSSQREAIKKIFKSNKIFNFCFDRDYSGHDRFFSLELE